jgi:DNA polymerase elongation subunit (family B)
MTLQNLSLYQTSVQETTVSHTENDNSIDKTETQVNKVKKSARDIVQIVQNPGSYDRIVINEDELDLFNYFDQDKIKPWQPRITLKPFSELTQLILDIETTGLDSKTCQIVLIGLMNERGKSIIIDCLKDEKAGLKEFIRVVRAKKPELLCTFNGFSFDLPFLLEKFKKYGITDHPFEVNTRREKVFRTAQKFGKPAIYNDIYCTSGDKKSITIIDLYHQVLAWDFIARKLTEYSLKQSVLQMGLRKEQRLELSFEEMMIIVKSGNLEKFKEYLVYDLEDIKLLADTLIPGIYYQKLILPDWNLQSLSTSGNGSKWNDILKKHYIKDLPESSVKYLFQGGLTGANNGLFINASKIDVSSLYPSIMLTYGVCPDKDKDCFMLSVLKYLKDFRMNLKDKKKEKTATSEEIRTEASYKVLINSGYGALGTMGIEFNDYVAAALVTAYGRKILKLMMKIIIDNGGKIATCDTDGIWFSTDDPTFEKNRLIHKLAKKLMPKGIDIDYENEAIALFVPPNDKIKTKKTKKNKSVDNSETQTSGLKKNYIMVLTDGRIKCKGRFVKRDVCKLQKDFQPQIVKLLTDSKQKANSYYQEILQQMKSGIYPISNLTITRKIRKGEKTLVNQGVGKEGDEVSFYRAADKACFSKKTGKLLKKTETIFTSKGVPNWEYYIDLVEKMYHEVIQFTEVDNSKNLIEVDNIEDSENAFSEKSFDSFDDNNENEDE